MIRVCVSLLQSARTPFLPQQHTEAVDKGKSLESEIKQTKIRLDRAGKLVGLLEDERVHWKTVVEGLASSKASLVGNMMLAAGTVAYLAPFPADYREQLIEVAPTSSLAPTSGRLVVRSCWPPPDRRRWAPFNASQRPVQHCWPNRGALGVANNRWSSAILFAAAKGAYDVSLKSFPV